MRLPHPRLAHLPVLVPICVSAVLNTHKLAQNGYANLFYSAAVQSMLRSLHNFVFVSFDPGGLVTVDKPPLALWVQATSAKLFGFSPLSLLLPEAIAGVIAVALLYLILERRLGWMAALAGSLAMAVFPSFVAVCRENGVDSVLILLLVSACGTALRACENGRWRTLIACAVLVGLAFNTKTLAAYLAVPGIALGYLVCAPGTIPRRLAQLAVAGVVMLAVSFAWIAYVELTPASQRPYVGSSTNNTELGLTFEYNGFGRVEGQAGGPNDVVVKPGAYVPAKREQRSDGAAAKRKQEHRYVEAPTTAPRSGRLPTPTLKPVVTKGREANPIPFGGNPRLLRLFGVGLGDQAGWLLPFALFGGVALLALALLDRRRTGVAATEPSHDGDTAEHVAVRSVQEQASGRRDPRLACALVFGGWFLVEAVVLSLSKGIVHPYYVSALAPGTGAMAGGGVLALASLARSRRFGARALGAVLAGAAAVCTVIAQAVLLHREHYMTWFTPILVVVVAAGLAVLLLCALLRLRALAAPALALVFVAVLIAPCAYAATTWLAPAEGTFPAAGPKHDAGAGAYGVNLRDEGIDQALADYVATHDPGTRWELLTVASDTAAPMMLFGLDAGALGGYSGTDPAVDGPRLAGMVARREARYVLLGGEYSLRGGNKATQAVLKACKELAPFEWNSPVPYPFGLVLFDCAGRERALAAAG